MAILPDYICKRHNDQLDSAGDGKWTLPFTGRVESANGLHKAVAPGARNAPVDSCVAPGKIGLWKKHHDPGYYPFIFFAGRLVLAKRTQVR
jgi:hypothetical protein